MKHGVELLLPMCAIYRLSFGALTPSEPWVRRDKASMSRHSCIARQLRMTTGALVQAREDVDLDMRLRRARQLRAMLALSDDRAFRGCP